VSTLWLMTYEKIDCFAPYDLLEVPYIDATYALTSEVQFTPKGARFGVTIRDRVFTDCPFGQGRILSGNVKPGKKAQELAPRYAAPPKEKTTVNYGHHRNKQDRIRLKLASVPDATPIARRDAWQGALLKNLAERTAVTLPKDRAAARAACTRMAQEPGRAVAYYSIGAKAWRIGRVRGVLDERDKETETQRHGVDSKTGEKRARAYLKDTCIWLEFSEGAELGIVACPLSAMVGAATAARATRSLFFLDVKFDHGLAVGDLQHNRRDVFHLGGDMQGWCQCDLCFSWRTVPDDVYKACKSEEAAYLCEGGCESPFSLAELRFAPPDAPGRANKRLARKR